MKIKKGDNVIIIAGKDKGRRGNVLSVLPSKDKVQVEGINIVKKHVRPKKQGEKGQVIEIPFPMQASNMQIFCTKCKKGSRIAYKIEAKEKIRICKRCLTPLK
ncbi:MAG TPA: 50S ribosomal protein L24 [Candidatus Wildermuthbacteria bacterium]|nr:50S ribosomal protein L24 [Candidatus Wildermuthbacteria bacterium]